MKKSVKVILIIAGIILILGVGSSLMSKGFISNNQHPKNRKATLSPHEKQLAYLKKHQQEIVEFVKSQNPKVESVQIDWDETKWSQGGLFSATDYINICGTVNGLDNSSWGVDIPINEDGSVDMGGKFLGNEIRVGSDLL